MFKEKRTLFPSPHYPDVIQLRRESLIAQINRAVEEVDKDIAEKRTRDMQESQSVITLKDYLAMGLAVTSLDGDNPAAICKKLADQARAIRPTLIEREDRARFNRAYLNLLDPQNRL